MSFFKERMADAEFTIMTPLCLICLNRQQHKFDNAHPDKPTMTCKVLGDIPRALEMALSYDCGSFVLDEEAYKINKPLLPKDFDPNK